MTKKVKYATIVGIYRQKAENNSTQLDFATEPDQRQFAELPEDW